MLDLLRHSRASVHWHSGKFCRLPALTVFCFCALTTSSFTGSIAAAQNVDAADAPAATDDDVPPIEPLQDKEAFFPGVNAAELAALRDNTDFRPSEADAWYHLLALLEKPSPRT